MNNPFRYIPSDAMLIEQQRLVAHIERMCRESNAFSADVEKGKMFGILRCRDKEGREQVFWAFSGQIGGRFEWEGFVPAVFDYLDEEGYFRKEEKEISLLNERIRKAEEREEMQAAREMLAKVRKEAEADIEGYRAEMNAAKALRDAKRAEANGEQEKALIAESQFMKAELHRKKLRWRSLTAEAERTLEEKEGAIRKLKMERSRRSDQLQQWLFAQFVFSTQSGQQISLAEVNDKLLKKGSRDRIVGRVQKVALLPSGTGECCEPKLLHHAFSSGLLAEEIGMFWWGASPRTEVREHLRFYPACGGKCKPLLKFLLEENETEGKEKKEMGALRIVFEDNHLIVVNKPAGLLSVPGKEGGESVEEMLRRERPDCEELAMVHRLDMDTSGLLLVAKTKIAHRLLQQMFFCRRVEKTYIALLERPLEGEGRIELPLAPDYLDRPRQKVDEASGKPAATLYRSLGGNRVELHPLTGRTHQLRVHCAHSLGLANPILGDCLYGAKPHPRLCLHAAEVRFVHPFTRKEVCFKSEAGF